MAMVMVDGDSSSKALIVALIFIFFFILNVNDVRYCILNRWEGAVNLLFSLAGHFHLCFNTWVSTELPLVVFDPWWPAGSWLNTLTLLDFYVVLLLVDIKVF